VGNVGKGIQISRGHSGVLVAGMLHVESDGTVSYSSFKERSQSLTAGYRWEQDQSYMLLGMAVRMGLDLNLYRKNEHGKVFTDEDRTRAYEVSTVHG
jgi:hypothetical protein